MRIRATVAAVTGALALSALAVPAAQAADAGSVSPTDARAAVQAARQAASGNTTFTGTTTGTPYPLDATFSAVKVNNGKPIVVGTTNKVTVPVTYKVTHAADIDLSAEDVWIDVELYRGDYASEDGNILFGDDWPVCTAASTTVANCKGTIDIYPGEELTNADATGWKAAGYVIDWNDQDPLDENIDLSKVGYAEQYALAGTKLQRYSKLTVNAAPEPVKKGKTITVTGKLTRANWDDGKYHGYTVQPVKLQFRKKGATAYTTVKTIKTNSTGALKTTVKASADGYFRYSFAGTSTTPAVTTAGDYVDVK
ncbi:hypothetical protein OG562_19020 [Streptomyces sp. NBC_01275]|uniref:hypothetical protein n=1 Tax=Streptomyces sp. NBC_01275 TaxID=2903807 RepID=UPI002252E2F6|nr:hypothetical protein [Streptomyces sp. NBC_01275]MCX4763034.1 hypothetical protein [Streptomyces sp. NBC_01275]